MAHGQWRSASVLLALTFVLVVGAASRMQAQSGGPSQSGGLNLIVPRCDALHTDTPIASITPKDLTNSLPCAERFDAKQGQGLDGARVFLQQGFDFLSWMSFLGLNAPVDGRDITALTSDPTFD